MEQKNYTLVHAFTDDWRLETVTQTRFLNTIYALMDSYYNLWQPVLHQVEKRFVPADDMHLAYTRPIPPLERLIASGFLTPEALKSLRAQQQAIDLFALHDQILAKFQHLFAYHGANLDKPENVFETLAYPELFPLLSQLLRLCLLQHLLTFSSYQSLFSLRFSCDRTKALYLDYLLT